MTAKNIILIGGSGFIGTHLAAKLSTLGHSVCIPSRKPERQNHLKLLPNISLIKADIHQAEQLNKLCQNQDVVINLLGILNDSKHNGFRLNHIEFIKKLITACQKNKIQRVLHLSALGANQASGHSLYLRSKGEGENLMHTFGQKDLHVTSFQPSVVYGNNDHFISQFASLVDQSFGVLPLVCPNSRFSPVHVDDLCQIIINSIDDKNTFAQRIPVCGHQNYSFKEIVSLIAKSKNSSCFILPLPKTISKLFAYILQNLPGKLFTIDQFKSLQTDSTGAPLESHQYQHNLEHYLHKKNSVKDYDAYRKIRR